MSYSTEHERYQCISVTIKEKCKGIKLLGIYYLQNLLTTFMRIKKRRMTETVPDMRWRKETG